MNYDVKIEDQDKIETHADKKVWSLFANYFGEVNSYLLTLKEAKEMVVPAIDEDGFCQSDLIIYTAGLKDSAQ